MLNLDCARVLRPPETDNFLLLLVFIIVGGILFAGQVVSAGGSGWRAFMARWRGGLRYRQDDKTVNDPAREVIHLRPQNQFLQQ